MISRILLCVACLSLLTASEAQAQLFRRLLAPQPLLRAQPQYRAQPQFRGQPQVQTQPQVRLQPQVRTQPQVRLQPQVRTQPQVQLQSQIRTQPQVRLQPPQVRTQPLRYAQQPGYYQNGYQGRLTASQPSRPLYIRRPDSPVIYYRSQPTQAAAYQAQLQRNAQLDAANRARQAQLQAFARGSNVVTTQGQLRAVQPTTFLQPQAGSIYLNPLQAATTPVGTPVGIRNGASIGASVLSAAPSQTSFDSIAPATSMPEAVVNSPPAIAPTTIEPQTVSSPEIELASPVDPASSIPFSTTATNPAPTGLSLSTDPGVIPASALESVDESPVSEPVDEAGEGTFSVLESIE